MSLAAYETARQLSAQAFYYQSEQNQSLVHPYYFDSNGTLVCEVPFKLDATMNIDEFLRMYVDHYKPGEFRDPFERNVAAVLQPLSPEYEFLPNVELTGVSGNVEIDFILRYRNTLAVGEVKLKAKKTDGIDQLSAVTDQRTLGTYTKKFLVSANDLHPNDKDLAIAYRICTVILPSGREKNLSQADCESLIRAIRKEMEPHP
jgi:hypothetical protein